MRVLLCAPKAILKSADLALFFFMKRHLPFPDATLRIHVFAYCLNPPEKVRNLVHGTIFTAEHSAGHIVSVLNKSMVRMDKISLRLSYF